MDRRTQEQILILWLKAEGGYSENSANSGAEAKAIETAPVVEAPKAEKKAGEDIAKVEDVELKPIGRGKFGNIYDQFRGKPKEALAFLKENKEGDLIGVFYHDEIGDIDLVWGDEKSGLSHINSKHVGDNRSFATLDIAIEHIEDIIKSGDVTFTNGDKVVIKKNDELVTLRKNIRENGKKIADKNWILTAYNEKAADNTRAISVVNKGHAAPTTDFSVSKVSENNSNIQENTAKSSIVDRDKAIGEARFSVEPLIGNKAIFDGMRKLEEGETSHVERVFTENKNFEFTTKNRIESYDDVAYIFKELENEAVENTFVALVKDGKPTVVHLGMGTSTASMVDFISANVAVRRINPDKIYFVHNHPSGILKASQQDMNILDAMKNAFGEDVVQDGIIINTFSGKYGTFGAYGDIELSDIPRDQEEFPIKVHSFSKSVYDRGYKPTPAKSSADIAVFITSQRLGDRPKIGMIIANNQLQIIGNIFLPYSEFTEENADAIANDIAYYTSVMGGNAAFLFGNAKLSEIEVKGLRNKVEYRANKQIRLLDYIEVDGGRYKSANDGGVRFRFSESEEEFRATQKEAVEKKGIVMPNLNNAVVEIVDVPEHNFKGNLKEARAEAKKWAIENYVGKEFAMPKNGGAYIISKNAIDKYLDKTSIENSENASVHLSALTKIPEIISNSITGEIHADYRKGDDGERRIENGIGNIGLLVHRLYGAINLNNEVYRVKTTVREFVDINKENTPHSYEVIKIEPIEDRSATRKNDDHRHMNRSNSSIDGANLLHEVEKSYDKGKYLLGGSVKNVKSSEEEDDYSGEGGVRFRFIGEEGAKSMDKKEGTTARMDNLAVAKKMLDEYSYKEVKMATGWEKGMDGKWRYETPDFEQFDINGNLKFVQRHPDYARYRELVKKSKKPIDK